MERKYTFNENANEYEKYRPPYPEQLFRDILEFAELKTNDEILEIGCGSGQATTGFVNLGYSNITAIELGENLAELTRQKFRNKQAIKIINSQFEIWNHESKHFYLAISGTAFHFIEPQEFTSLHTLSLIIRFVKFIENMLRNSMILKTRPWNRLLRTGQN
jgi:protein-L-isoaspartate O-methyltransferase